MTPNIIEQLEFSTVSFNQQYQWIEFSIQSQHYRLVFRDGLPKNVFHTTEGIECEFCGYARNGSLNDSCSFFTDCVDELYEKFKGYPNVRIRMMFSEYK